MKYIVFKHKTGTYMPVIIPEHVVHSSVKIKDAEPFSAGFFYLQNGDIDIPPQGSESLKLKPSILDKRLITSVLVNSGIYAFMMI